MSTATPTPTLIERAATHGRLVWHNWARSYSARPAYWHRPTTIDQLRAIVTYAREHGDRVRFVGHGHSPSDIVVTDAHLISMLALNAVLWCDRAQRRIRVQAGIALTDLNEVAAANGLAFGTLGAISDQSVGGTIATGTHGTGRECPILAGYVHEFDLLRVSDGEIVTCSRTQNADLFHAALLNLGCLGVITEVTLQLDDAFDLLEHSQLEPFDEVMQRMDEIIDSAAFVRLHWFPYVDSVLVTRMHKMPPKGATVTAAATSTSASAPTSSTSSTSAPTPTSTPAPTFFASLHSVWLRFLTVYLYQALLFVAIAVPAIVPWINRAYCWFLYRHPVVRTDRSDRIFNFDCLFSQHVSEWAIPRSDTARAMTELRAMVLRDRPPSTDFPVEVRFVRRDDIWLSPAFGCDTAYIGVISYRPFGFEPRAFRDYFGKYERIMHELHGRPHWAKQFDLPTRVLAAKYPRWHDFARVRRELDPRNMLVNEYVARLFVEEGIAKEVKAKQSE